MLHGEGRHEVPIAAHGLVGLELARVEREGQAPDQRVQRPEEGAQPRRPVEDESELTAAQGEGLEHAGQAEHVIGVEVGEEDVLELDQADRAQELALGALAAVEQQPVAPAAHERGRQAAARAGGRAGGAEEEHVEIHRPSIRAPAAAGTGAGTLARVGMSEGFPSKEAHRCS